MIKKQIGRKGGGGERGGKHHLVDGDIYKQIIQTNLHTFPLKISWEKLIKD